MLAYVPKLPHYYYASICFHTTIMLAYVPMLPHYFYAQSYASIISQGLPVLQSKRANFVVFKIFCYIQESVQERSTLSL